MIVLLILKTQYLRFLLIPHKKSFCGYPVFARNDKKVLRTKAIKF